MFETQDTHRDNQLTPEEYLDRFPDQEEGKRRFPNFDKTATASSVERNS